MLHVTWRGLTWFRFMFWCKGHFLQIFFLPKNWKQRVMCLYNEWQIFCFLFSYCFPWKYPPLPLLLYLQLIGLLYQTFLPVIIVNPNRIYKWCKQLISFTMTHICWFVKTTDVVSSHSTCSELDYLMITEWFRLTHWRYIR